MEMKELTEHTGGTIVQTDPLPNPVFEKSLDRMFDGTATDMPSNRII